MCTLTPKHIDIHKRAYVDMKYSCIPSGMSLLSTGASSSLPEPSPSSPAPSLKYISSYWCLVMLRCSVMPPRLVMLHSERSCFSTTPASILQCDTDMYNHVLKCQTRTCVVTLVALV